MVQVLRRVRELGSAPARLPDPSARFESGENSESRGHSARTSSEGARYIAEREERSRSPRQLAASESKAGWDAPSGEACPGSTASNTRAREEQKEEKKEESEEEKVEPEAEKTREEQESEEEEEEEDVDVDFVVSVSESEQRSSAQGSAERDPYL